jgi:hypothetical protein
MARSRGRYSIVSIVLLTTVVALAISLYQTNRWLHSASDALASAFETRWPDPNQLNALLDTNAIEIIDYDHSEANASWQLLTPNSDHPSGILFNCRDGANIYFPSPKKIPIAWLVSN